MAVTGGFWGLPCWNALSDEQRDRLLKIGNLPIGWKPEGEECDRPAQCCVETQWDLAPGPRFLCIPCAIRHLSALQAIKDIQ